MYLMRFASFAWGVYAGYKHSPLVVVLAVSASLVIGNIWVSRKQIFRNDGSNVGAGYLVGGLALYFGMAFVTSLMSQGFGYLIGYFIRGAT